MAALVALCASAAACARVPPPPYPLNFTVEGRAPRLLTSADEIAIPLTVVNSGTRAWDPARVHLSYHWLWFVPREITSRSRWNVPYHGGIRTELGRRVDPGQTARLDGRLLAPSIPGVYWLQWDMVEEGAVWFAQVAPRQPRTIVIVVPPAVWIFAPLPVLIAIVGLVRLKPHPTRVTPRPIVGSGSSRTWIAASRFSRTSTAYDVFWCAAVLFAKPFVIIHDALLEPTAVAYWLIVAVAVIVPAIVAVVTPRRVRPWILLLIGIFASVVVLADVVYYRFFGDVMSAPALLGAHQTGHVWGSIRSLVTPGLLWLVVDWPFAIALAYRISTLRTPSSRLSRRAIPAAVALAVVAISGLAISAPRALAATPLDQMFRDRAVVEQLGPFGFHAYDAWTYARTAWWKPAVSDAAVQQAIAWFAGRAALRRGGGTPEFSIARGKNLIVVQVESLQDFVVDFTVDGQEVMPFLRRWTDDSVRFTSVTDQTSEGRTSDAEFTTMASLLPLDHGAVAFRYPANHYVALPRVLRERGYSTLSAVPFEPGFWNRAVMHPSYGFERSLFEPDFQMTEQIGWGLNDRDFLQQMVPRLEQLRSPFLAWMITLSLHHPFEDFPAAHKTLKLGAVEGTSFGNYLHTMHFFDDALEAFKQSLARDGLLDRSVVVVFGDHDAGFARTAELAASMHIDADEASWALNDRIPWFVRLPDREPRGIRSMTAGQTDFAPTLLALLGVDAAPLPYVGRNLFGAPDNPPIVRPYGDWIDADHLFVLRGSDRVCVDRGRRSVDEASACDRAEAAARQARDISRLVVTADLQRRIADALSQRD